MNKTIITAAFIAALGAAAPSHATGARVDIGTLSCHEASGWGFIFGSSHQVRCTYSGEGKVAHYRGSISKFGADIGYQQSGVLIWEVLSPTDRTEPGAIAGHYGGLTAGATVGVGLGANALVGGSTGAIALQPLSIEGKTGLNVAAGIGALNLARD